MKHTASLLALGLLFGACPAGSEEAPPEQPAPAPPPAPKKKDTLDLFGSWRVRQEAWDWFGPGSEGRYTFTGSLLRFGAAYRGRRDDLTLELSQPTLLNLPKDASLAAPLGQLGLGGAYRDANKGQEASLFVKQAFWRRRGIGDASNSLRLGRFEFIDGAEVMPKDPSLAWLKRERIAHRLIGSFGWSHVQRSFDGGEFVHDTPDLNVTAFAGVPTEGVFDLDGQARVRGVQVGYASVTKPLPGRKRKAEGRLFALHYVDDRDRITKTDNRPSGPRGLDQDPVSVTTLGGHLVGVWETGAGKLDALAWGAAQFGEWGTQSHGAYAFAAEAGFQPKDTLWNPWFRAGFYRGSGDGDPNDGRHGTFFPVLPTPRIYARFPFYTLANVDDAFVQAILRPTPKLTVRADAHFLSLASRNDLWYAGGGVFQDQPSFGYAGRPGNGSRSLATLVDLSADFQVRKNTTLSAYFGCAFAGDVIRSIYGPRAGGLFGYLELTQRF